MTLETTRPLHECLKNLNKTPACHLFNFGKFDNEVKRCQTEFPKTTIYLGDICTIPERLFVADAGRVKSVGELSLDKSIINYSIRFNKGNHS